MLVNIGNGSMDAAQGSIVITDIDHSAGPVEMLAQCFLRGDAV